jgi:hypothetical protein
MIQQMAVRWRLTPPRCAWLWRTRADGGNFERVAERVQLRVEAFGERITRITATVEVRGWREGGWVMIEETGPVARDLLARIRMTLG